MGGKAIYPGERFGRLVTIAREDKVSSSSRVRPHWRCRCDCGNESAVDSGNLRNGNSTQCRRCSISSRSQKRKTSASRFPELYAIWKTMKTRVNNPRSASYARYGGRGITIDPSWYEFDVFLADMGPRPSEDHQIERIDNDGPYSPENCIWGTRQRQANNKCNNRFLEINGAYRTLAQWCRDYGTNRDRVRARLDDGWSLKDALEKPLRYMIQKSDYSTPDGIFLSLRQVAEHYDMSVSGVNTRFNSDAFPDWRRISRDKLNQ